MKLFQCQHCGQTVYFENIRCLRCDHVLGYIPHLDRMAAVEPDGSIWRMLSNNGEHPNTQRWRFCRNWEVSACNWMLSVTEDSNEGVEFCPACAHNRTIPDLSDPENTVRWQKIEGAKRRLIYSILRLNLPHPLPDSNHSEPLVFDFLADDPHGEKRVVTGHSNGIITIDLNEADDAKREKMRLEMDEVYRTLLGHFRHEVGHYYWDLLVRDGNEYDSFRTLFGDERADYSAALDRHYREGPPINWKESHVSPYATMHPWEDWAETWAHYLHIVDTLETAAALGIQIEPEIDKAHELVTEINFNPYKASSANQLISTWIPLTVALNILNRSMGQSDLYPFGISEQVKQKLSYIHSLIKKISANN